MSPAGLPLPSVYDNHPLNLIFSLPGAAYKDISWDRNQENTILTQIYMCTNDWRLYVHM